MKLLILIAVSILAVGNLMADDEVNDLESQVNTLERKVSELESKLEGDELTSSKRGSWPWTTPQEKARQEQWVKDCIAENERAHQQLKLELEQRETKRQARKFEQQFSEMAKEAFK